MAAADYSEDIASAVESITEAGITCKLSRAGATIDVPAVITEYKPVDIGKTDGSGKLILFGDKKVLIPGGLSRNPDTEQDRFIVPVCDIYPTGASFQIIDASPVGPSGQAIIWQLQVRK